MGAAPGCAWGTSGALAVGWANLHLMMVFLSQITQDTDLKASNFHYAWLVSVGHCKKCRTIES